MFPRFVLVALLLIALWGGLAHASGASGHGGTYVVTPGDTLWSISHRFYGGDSRRGVWDLEQRNHLGQNAVLAPGQQLVLPW
ncbi:MAG: LysM domain-containing protein [Gaiellaceae bacterium]|jgi:LysM repeat protein